MTNLNAGKTVTDGGGSRTWKNNDGASPPSWANDGSVATTARLDAFVNSGGPNAYTAYIRTDLTTPTSVGSMSVLGANNAGDEVAWGVEHSSDGSSWTAVTGLVRSWDGATSSLTFDDATARYWRLVFLDTETGVHYVNGLFLYEWAIYAGAPPPPPPPPEVILDVNAVTFSHPKEVTVRVEQNAAGNGAMTIDRYDPDATALVLERGSIVNVTFTEIDPDPIFAFILEDGDWDLVSSSEKGGKELRFSGPGVLYLLHRCVIDSVEYEDGIGYPKPLKGYWEFDESATEGHILNKLMREATSSSRPQHPIAGVTWDFDSVNDSNGDPWADQTLEGKWRIPIGAYLYDEVIRLVAAGLMSVQMGPDLVLHAYRTHGVNRTGTAFGAGVVRFAEATNIADDLTRNQNGRAFMSHALVHYNGDDQWTRTPKDGTFPYVQEGLVEANTNNENTAKRLAKGNMGWLDKKQDAPQFAHKVPWPSDANDEAHGVYRPGPPGSENGLYWVGDSITIWTGIDGEDDLDYDDAAAIVYAITLTLDQTGYLAPPVVELNAPWGINARDYGDFGFGPSSLSTAPSASAGGSVGGGTGLPGGAYQPIAEKGHADGYADLDADALVPIDELGTGGDGSGDNVLYDDQTWRPPSGAALTVKDEGTPLATAATSIDFVGAGVTASGATAAKTVTISEPDAAAHLADTSDAHDASAISIVDAGGHFTGTDVEAALQELGAAGGSIPAHTYELANEGGDPLRKVHGSTGSTETIDPTDGNVHTLTLDASCTLTLGVPSGDAATLELWITQDSTGGRAITWPGSVTVIGTLATTANTLSVVILATADGGTSWLAVVIGSGTTFATPAIVLGTAAAAGTASTVIRSDATIAAFDATVPVTQAFSDAPATGSATVAARRDHKHGMPAGASGALLIADTHSTPLIFGDLLQTEAQDDLLYAD